MQRAMELFKQAVDNALAKGAKEKDTVDIPRYIVMEVCAGCHQQEPRSDAVFKSNLYNSLINLETKMHSMTIEDARRLWGIRLAQDQAVNG